MRRIANRILVAFRGDARLGSLEGSASPSERLLRMLVLALARTYGWIVRRFSSERGFVSAKGLEWVARLESSWPVIREELERLRGGFELPALIDVVPGERAVSDARWKMLFLRYSGRPVPANCALCPRTADLLAHVPGLISGGFSVLQGGAYIARHRGLFAGILRYHLALIVPEPAEDCGIRIGAETRHWVAGRSLLFEDTCDHEAWNRSQQDRAVLLLDVKRPLPGTLRRLNDAALLLLSRFLMPSLVRFEHMGARAAPASPPAPDPSVSAAGRGAENVP